jgi:hypothetical protein
LSPAATAAAATGAGGGCTANTTTLLCIHLGITCCNTCRLGHWDGQVCTTLGPAADVPNTLPFCCQSGTHGNRMETALTTERQSVEHASGRHAKGVKTPTRASHSTPVQQQGAKLPAIIVAGAVKSRGISVSTVTMSLLPLGQIPQDHSCRSGVLHTSQAEPHGRLQAPPVRAKHKRSHSLHLHLLQQTMLPQPPGSSHTEH